MSGIDPARYPTSHRTGTAVTLPGSRYSLTERAQLAVSAALAPGCDQRDGPPCEATCDCHTRLPHDLPARPQEDQ